MTNPMSKAYGLLQFSIAMIFDAAFGSPDPKPNNSDDILTWPNLVSILRAPLGIILVIFNENAALGLSVILLAAFTDLVDGVLAQYFFGPTRSGAIIDPLCDKIFFFFCALAYWQLFDPTTIFVVIVMEAGLLALLTAVYIFCLFTGKRIPEKALRSNIWGKSRFAFEVAAFLCPMVGLKSVATPILWIVVVFGLASVIKQVCDNRDLA